MDALPRATQATHARQATRAPTHGQAPTHGLPHAMVAYTMAATHQSMAGSPASPALLGHPGPPMAKACGE